MNEESRPSDTPSRTAWCRSAEKLFDQQLWLFGYDIRRAEGNLLAELGCNRIAAPEGSDCSSCYQVVLDAGQRLTLRGFGVSCDDPTGPRSVFLHRDSFAVSVLPAKPCKLPWRPSDVQADVGLPAAMRGRAALLVQSIARWIAGYERRVAERLGTSYRQHALKERDKPFEAAPDELPSRWRQVANDLERWPDLLAGARQRRQPKRRRAAKALASP